jgi:hypothetical protein
MRANPRPKIAIKLSAAYALLACTNAGFAQNVPPTAPVQTSMQLAPFSATGAQTLHPAWRLTGLPAKLKVPNTRFELVSVKGEQVLQISTDKSYGVLTHAWQGAHPAQLAWRWRVTQPVANANLSTKAGDDAALKVCVMFDQALADIPLLQRASLALARAATGQDLPSATLCYVWDARTPMGTAGANPYSARVRYLVLDGAQAQSDQWQTQQRRVADDFQALFGAESPVTPPIIAVAVGADSDNTQGQSTAYLSQLRWLP